MNREELAKLRSIHDTKGLRLDTASGLSGSIYDADGSATAPVTALLDECARSFGKDAEITELKSQLEEARAKAIAECAAELHRQAEFRHGAHKKTVLSLAENLRALNGRAK